MTNQATVSLDAPRFENARAMLIAGLRGHFTTATWAGIPAQWERLGSYGQIPGQAGLAHYGLCFSMSDGIDYLSGVEVSGGAGLPGEFSSASIPAQRYVVFAQRQHVSKLRETLDAIGREWFPGSGYEAAGAVGGAPDFFERYGEGFDPGTGMGDVEVWIPIKS
jgi:AraC family transcriptional regulator